MPNFMDKINAGLLGPTTNYGGIIDSAAEQNARDQAKMAMYARLLAAGGPSSQPTSIGQAIGGAMQAGQQTQSAGLQQALQAQLMKSRIDAQKNRLTPDGMGDYQPGDYTPASWAKFIKSKDPNDLQRYERPFRDPMPSFKTVTRTLPDGSTELGSFDTRTREFQWTGQIVPAGIKAEADAAGTARGAAVGGQDAKAPAKASFDAAISNLRASIKDTPQGMISGPLGTVTAYGDKKLFQSRIQQLSAELRTVYRIPGEGTLSDQEQQQYALQLPNTDFPQEVNDQILDDLEQRTGLRLQTPIGNTTEAAPKQHPGAKKPKETAAERAKRLGL